MIRLSREQHDPGTDVLFELDYTASLVWGAQQLPYNTVISVIRDTELDPTSLPLTIARYLSMMEFIYVHKKDLIFLLGYVYVPANSSMSIILRIDMNIGFLDMCTATEYVGTLFSDMEISSYMVRIDKLSKLTTHVANMVRLSHSYGTDNQPSLISCLYS